MDERLVSFFALAKQVTLTSEERRSVWQSLQAHVDVLAPVRESSAKRLDSAMSFLDKTLFGAAHAVRLHPQEKEACFQRIRAFMDVRPPRNKGVDPSLSLFDRLFHPFAFRALPATFMVLLLLVSAGGGLAYAADRTLPGDILYPFKINITEPFLQSFAASAEAEAWWDARFAERRLEELEELAEADRLYDDISDSVSKAFAVLSQRARDRILLLQARGHHERATELMMQFESTLDAHYSMLTRMSEEGKSGMQAILIHVDKAGKDVQAVRNTLENEASNQGSVRRIVSNTAYKKADLEMAQIRSLVRQAQQYLPEEELSRVQDQLALAEDMLVRARTESGSTALADMMQITRSILRDTKDVQRIVQLRRNGLDMKVEFSKRPARTTITQPSTRKTEKVQVVVPNTLRWQQVMRDEEASASSLVMKSSAVSSIMESGSTSEQTSQQAVNQQTETSDVIKDLPVLGDSSEE